MWEHKLKICHNKTKHFLQQLAAWMDGCKKWLRRGSNQWYNDVIMTLRQAQGLARGNRSMKKIKSINITKLTEKYGPGYVAKDKKTGKVVAHASRVDVLMNKIKAGKKEKKTVISWVPKHGAQYVFNISLRIRRS